MIDLQQNCHFVFSKCVDSRQKNSHIFILSCFSVLFALIFPVVKKKAPNKKQGTNSIHTRFLIVVLKISSTNVKAVPRTFMET
jgi:hypothetical protein